MILRCAIQLSAHQFESFQWIASLSLVCQSWRNLLGNNTFWNPLIEECSKQLADLTFGRYRMNSVSLRALTPMQRFFCCARPLSKNALQQGFSGLGYALCETSLTLFQGVFVNGTLCKGVCYVIKQQIEDGLFDESGSFVLGRFDVWDISDHSWITFFGKCRPHLDFHDFGVASWSNGMSYVGEFHHIDLHGFGILQNNQGEIIESGIWSNNALLHQLSGNTVLQILKEKSNDW